MSSDDLAVSVVLPVYFGEVTTGDIGFLRRALASVQEQKFVSSYEIVLVDDGSAVPIADLVSHIGSDLFAHTRIIQSIRNNGLSHALNLGIREARYPLIARLDSDDRWRPTKIEKQLALFKNDPELTITATGMTRVDFEGNQLDDHIRPGDWEGILKFFVEIGCPFPHGSVIARKSIYLALGGYSHHPHVRHCEDYALWWRWLRFFKPAMVEESLYEYTVSEVSVCDRHSVEQAEAARNINATFKTLDLVDKLPGALQRLADSLGLSLLEVGLIAHDLWQYGVAIPLPDGALEPLRQLLPDRHIRPAEDHVRVSEMAAQLAGKFPYGPKRTYIAAQK